MIEVVLHRVGVVTLSILSCAAHQILTNSMLCMITHRFMTDSSKVFGQRKKRRTLGSESGSGNLMNTRRAPASLARAARDPARGVRDQEAIQEALMDGLSPSPSPSRRPNGDTPKRQDRLASLARDQRAARDPRAARDREAIQEALMDGPSPSPSPSRRPNGDTPKRQDRLASLARDPRAARDREAIQEALMDGLCPSRSRSPDGDTPKRQDRQDRQDRQASLARDPVAAKAVRDREADQEVQKEDGPSRSQNPSRNGMVMVTKEYKPSSTKTMP
jgi:hypothetical protein